MDETTEAPVTSSTGSTDKEDNALFNRAKVFARWFRDIGLGTSGYFLLLIVVTAGFTASFIGLHAFGEQHMSYTDHQAWLVPTAIDGADIGLSVNALRAAMNGRPAVLNRIMIVACTSISSAINYAHISDYVGRRIAALLPILAVILLESLMSEARAAYERANNEPRPRLALLRWVFDFKGTLEIIKAYTLRLDLPEPMAQAAEALQQEEDQRKPRATHPRHRPHTPRRPIEIEEPKPNNVRPIVSAGSKLDQALQYVVAQHADGRDIHRISAAEVDKAIGSNGYVKKHMDRLREQALAADTGTAASGN